MSELQPFPAHALSAAMWHLLGAAPSLRSYSSTGPTVYTLAVFGVKHNTVGAATLAGPALDAGGLAAGWSAEARGAAVRIFEGRQGRRRGGAVLVIIAAQVGRALHCTVASIPGNGGGRGATKRPPPFAGGT